MKYIIRFWPIALVTALMSCAGDRQLKKFEYLQSKISNFTDSVSTNDEGEFYELSHKLETSKTVNHNSLLDIQLQALNSWLPSPQTVQREPHFVADTLKKRLSCGALDFAPEDSPRSPRLLTYSPDFFEQATFEIPVIFHVITEVSGKGIISDSQIKAQIDSLNRAFAPINVHFTLRQSHIVKNNEWFSKGAYSFNRQDKSVFKGMTSALASNPMRVMNVYSLNGETSKILGEAFIPGIVHGTSADAIIVHYTSLPNGVYPYNEGNSLIHEVGHYLGLRHTFHDGARDGRVDCDTYPYDGCSGDGDLIEDTPPQKFCHFLGCGSCAGDVSCQECPGASKCDTCPNDGKLDAFSNYMGYNPDACLNNFTRGQYIMIKRTIFKFRPNFVVMND